MPSEALVRVVKPHQKDSETEMSFDTKPTQVTEVTLTNSSVGTEEDPVRPYMETTRRTPMRDNSDKAPMLD